MPSLRETQQRFVDAVLHEQADPAGMIADGRFAAARHLQVYRNNVFESLTGALRAVYAAIERLVGDGFFRYAAHEYIQEHPPTSGNLHDFGNRFAAFLADFPPAAAYAYLPDVARLEWAWHEAFHAADAPSFDLASLASVAPDQHPLLRFHLHPSARFLVSRFPVIAIWEANISTDGEIPEINLDAGADRVLVIRRGLQVEVERLGMAEYALLAAMVRREHFDAACEAALAEEPELDLTGRLHDHIRRGTLTGFSL